MTKKTNILMEILREIANDPVFKHVSTARKDEALAAIRAFQAQTIASTLDRVEAEVIGEDENLNVPLNREIDGNPESDSFSDLHIIRRAVRNVSRTEQRQIITNIRKELE